MMKNVILECISFYENAVFKIEKIIIEKVNQFEYEQNHEDREKITLHLQKILAKNCNLRKKDFDLLMHSILFDIEEKERQIKSENSEITKKVKDYLEEQKHLVKSLRLNFAEFNFVKSNLDEIRKLSETFKEEYEKKASEILKELRSFEQHYQFYTNKQNIIMKKLQEIVDKDKELQVKDLMKIKEDQDKRV
jgi:glucan-binding YG repeat protein